MYICDILCLAINSTYTHNHSGEYMRSCFFLYIIQLKGKLIISPVVGKIKIIFAVMSCLCNIILIHLKGNPTQCSAPL
jgi:hypothetical protein